MKTTYRATCLLFLALPILMFSVTRTHAQYVDATDPRLVYLGAWLQAGTSMVTLYPGSQVRIRLQGQATLDIQNLAEACKLKVRPRGSNGGTVRTINQNIVLDAPGGPEEFEINYMAYDSGRAWGTGAPRFQLHGLTLGVGATLLQATDAPGVFFLDFTGDSITHAVRVLSSTGGGLQSMDGTLSFGYLLSRMKNGPYRVRGHSGESLTTFWEKIGFFARNVPLPADPQPNFLFFNIGANNLSWSNSDFQRRMEDALQEARTRMPNSYIVVLNFFNQNPSRTSPINSAINRKAKGKAHLFNAQPSLKGRFTDGIHPTSAAHADLATALRNHLRHQPVTGDFDGDGEIDPATFWHMSGIWTIWSSLAGTGSTQNLGFAGTQAFAADFDGDGIDDRTFYSPRHGGFLISRSQDGKLIRKFGPKNIMTPIIGDYDGDGVPDLALYTAKYGGYLALLSQNGAMRFKFGGANNIPVVGDFDGDGIDDFAVYNTKTYVWTIRRSTSGNNFTVNWGSKGAIPAPGHFDNDNITDIAVFVPSTGTWEIRLSDGPPKSVQWGSQRSIPVVADYDGDGIDDIAVYDPDHGRWFVIDSTTDLGRNFYW